MPNNQYAWGVPSVGSGSRTATNLSNRGGGVPMGGGGGGGGGFDMDFFRALLGAPTPQGQPNNNPGQIAQAWATNNVGMANADSQYRQALEAARASMYGADANRDAILGAARSSNDPRYHEATLRAGADLGMSRNDLLARQREAEAQENIARTNSGANVNIADIMRQMNLGTTGLTTGSNERIASGRNQTLGSIFGSNVFDTLSNALAQGLGGIGSSMGLVNAGLLPGMRSGVPAPQPTMDAYTRMVDQLRGVA